MPKCLRIIFVFIVTAQAGFAQLRSDIIPHPVLPDSVSVKVHPRYGERSKLHNKFFGANYRQEWSMTVKLPLLKMSQVYGGLIPVREGGGMQSKSLRLKDNAGKEWVLRTVEKTPDKLLPEGLHGTFAIDWLDDAMSGQHPFSALVVPPMAEAAGVPHAHPVIGVVAEDATLGNYNKIFKGKVCLLEEREPTGESDNTIKMLDKLVDDNSNRFNKENFLKARMLDLLLGDWDRHEDQWRWAYNKNGKERLYIGVPRDRDQVFHVNQGLFPNIASWSFVDPILDNFQGSIPRVRYSIFKTRFVQPYVDAQFTYEEWIKVVAQFVKAETDDVLEAGLKRLPVETYNLRHNELLRKLKGRRDAIPAAMDEYYRFINKIVDLRFSDKNEEVTISNASDKNLRVVVTRLNKSGEAKEQLMDMIYRTDITKELRIFMQDGNDRVNITNTSPIKVTLVGGHGDKIYAVNASSKSIKLFDKPDSLHISGAKAYKLNQHLSRDTANVSFIPTNRYNVWMPLLTAGINADDGFLLGAGFKYTGQQGFRKVPYTTVQQVLITHAFATDAFRIRYNGEWIKAVGKADFTLQANIQAPDNTANFFGLGNETVLNKFKGYRRYYRTRFDTYQVDPQLRFHTDSVSSFSIGPSFQYYHLDFDDNTGRFITQTNQLHSRDSAVVGKNKAHVGFITSYVSNHRNNPTLPYKGYYLSVTLQGYKGISDYAESFVQLKPEFTFYQKINSKGTIVLSDRIGGGITLGKPAFYQALDLGGQGNLLGYLQYRFAGKQMVYNNLQARVKIANIASYILPGQLGVTGFYDTGRVWIENDQSNKWHNGVGGGLYFAPAGLTVVQFLMGHSNEGWYPYFSMNFRI